MPFPTNETSNATLGADRLADIGRRIRAECTKYIAQCDGGSVNAHDLVAMAANFLRPARADWAAISVVSGVPAAVRDKFPGAGFASDAAVTTEMTADLAAIDAALTYIVTNTPKDGSGYLLTLQISGNQFVQRTVTDPTQRANLKAALTSLLNAFSP